MEAKYTIVLTDKELFECQKKAWLAIEDSADYKKLPENFQELIKAHLREYCKMLQGTMWKENHVAFTDGVVLASLMENYTEAVPEEVVKQAAIKLLSKCPAETVPVKRKQEPARDVLTPEQAVALCRRNFIMLFGVEPKPLKAY